MEYMRFDKNEFADLLNKAKGKRSINKYALDSEVDAAYISRLMRGLINTPPGAGVINKLSSKAHNDVTVDDLMIAAGYITKEEILKAVLPNMSIHKSDKETEMEKDIRELFQSMKDNPDDPFAYMDEQDKKWLIDYLHDYIKEDTPDEYRQLASNVMSKKEEKLMKLLEEAKKIPEDEIGQVIDFIKFLKSKNQ